MNMDLNMNTVDALSELGEWKGVVAYPNKLTLKILKHVRYAATEEASVTLYRKGTGDILSVDSLLKGHFGEDATLPEVLYKSTYSKYEKPNYITESVDLILDD